MTCPHGISTARMDVWWNREEARAKANPQRPEAKACACCGGPFIALTGFEGETTRCSHCVLDAAVQQYQYEVTA